MVVPYLFNAVHICISLFIEYFCTCLYNGIYFLEGNRYVCMYVSSEITSWCSFGWCLCDFTKCYSHLPSCVIQLKHQISDPEYFQNGCKSTDIFVSILMFILNDHLVYKLFNLLSKASRYFIHFCWSCFFSTQISFFLTILCYFRPNL